MPTTPLTSQVVRDRGDRGRVVRHTYADGRQVFAKHYPTRAEARRCVEVLIALRDAGFHGSATVRVPEVLDHRPDQGLVVLASASGAPLAGLVRDPVAAHRPGREDWVEGVRGAARWLAALHDTPPSVCGSDDTARPPLARLEARGEALVAARPELAADVDGLLHTLAGRRPVASHAVDRLTHGRFHPEHVFLQAGTDVVTGIDLDRAGPDDPGRDLGEFVHRVRSMLARAHRRGHASGAEAPATSSLTDSVPGGAATGPDGQDRATAEFLGEYRRARDTDVDLTSLAYHWSFAAVWHLFGSLRKGRSQSSVDRYRAELEAVPRLVHELL